MTLPKLANQTDPNRGGREGFSGRSALCGMLGANRFVEPDRLRTQSGYGLVELCVVVAAAGLLLVVGLPLLFGNTAALRVTLASQDIASALYLAKVSAIREGNNVAVRFTTEEDGSVHFQLFSDGDGDGVLNADIDAGVDPPVSPPRAFDHMGRGVGFGFPPGPAPRDPGDPSRRLDRLDDPVRFNRSDLASFNSLGAGTAGSVYLTDSQRELRVVRLLGVTGRVRILRYDSQDEVWF